MYVLKPLMSSILGEKLTIINLIITKSGTNIQIESLPVIATGGQELCKMSVMGAPAGVGLAGQMIQEVLNLSLFSKSFMYSYFNL